MPSSYWYGALWIALFSIGCGLGTGLLRTRKRMKILRTGESVWQQILPDRTRREWMFASLLIFFTSGLPFIALAVHLAAHELAGSGSRAFIILAIGIAAAEAFWVLTAFRNHQSLGDARVSVKQPVLQRDEDVEIQIEIPARGSAPAEIIARVVCIEHAVYHMGRYTQMCHRVFKEEPIRVAAENAGGNWVAGTGRVRFPAESWPASGYGKSLNFTYEWKLIVELHKTRPRYTVYPLHVV